MSDAAAVIAALRDAGRTVAVSESLTGGLLCARLVSVSGASDVVRGGVIAYATELKERLLGVDPDYLAAHGTVDAGTAEAMALGVRDRCGSDLGIATTGVAGPGPNEGKPAGTVFIAYADSVGAIVEPLSLSGDRDRIRDATVQAALRFILRRIRGKE